MEAFTLLRAKALIGLIAISNLVVGVPLYLAGKNAFGVAFISAMLVLAAIAFALRRSPALLMMSYRDIEGEKLARVRSGLFLFGWLFVAIPGIAAMLFAFHG